MYVFYVIVPDLRKREISINIIIIFILILISVWICNLMVQVFPVEFLNSQVTLFGLEFKQRQTLEPSGSDLGKTLKKCLFGS